MEKYDLKKLAWRSGKIETKAFNYNCKMTNVNWIYPCPRPVVKTVWTIIVCQVRHQDYTWAKHKVIQWTVIFQFFLCIHFSEKYTPQRSGLRERKRAESPKQTEPSVTEVWVPEEELEIWEIKQFGEK